MGNTSKVILKEISLSSSYARKCQADYDKWSTVLQETGKIKNALKELKEKIDKKEITDVKEISKELEFIINRY